MVFLAQFGEFLHKAEGPMGVVGLLGAPLLGFIFGCLRGGRTHARKRWMFLAGYYAIWASLAGIIASGVMKPGPGYIYWLWAVMILTFVGLLLALCLTVFLMIPARCAKSEPKNEAP